MAIKFLSGLNLSNVTAGSILKLDSNGNIVAATAGTDYASSNIWSTASSDNIYYSSGGVRIGTYQTSVDAAAKLHVFDYQTTDPKLLIEDGNTGDASMQFKISTQSYTMGIDNSDSDKFVLAASTALGTTNVLEISTLGASAFQKDVLFNEDVFVTGGLAVGTTSPDSVVHITGTTDGTGDGADAILHVSQQGGWNGNEPWALYVEGYTYLNGFRINAGDGIRALHKVASGGQLGFSVTDTAPITFTQSNETERMRVHTNGNVGIGTADPKYRFHAYHPTTNVVGQFESGDNQAWVSVRDSGYGTYGAMLGCDSANGQSIILADNGANKRLIISESGSLQLTAYTAGLLKTDANGDVSVDTTSYVDSSGDTMTGDLTIKRGHGDLTFLTLKQENTSADLEVQKSFIDFHFIDSNANDYPQVRIGAEVGNNDGSASTTLEEGMGAFVVYTNNATTANPGSPSDLSERFRVDRLGRVGIGTNNPSQKLHVAGDIYTTSDFLGNSIISANAALTISNTGIQPDQGEVEDIVAFNFSTTKVSHIDTDGYIHAAGFKTNTAATGFLKADGTVDTSTYLTEHPSITQASNVDNSNGTVLQDLTFDSNGHVTNTGSVDLDSRYYQKNISDAKYHAVDGSGKEWIFEVTDEGSFSGNKWYKVATVNKGNGGLHIRGFLSNHVENFASQKFDLAITDREGGSGGEIEIAGTVDVLHNDTGSSTDKAGIRVIQTADSDPFYDYFDVYIRTTRYQQLRVYMTRFGNAEFHTTAGSNPVTTEPAPVSGGNVELDTSSLVEGHYIVQDSTATAIGSMAYASTGDYKDSDTVESYVAQELTGYTPTSSFGANAFTSYTDHSTQGYLTSYTEADTLDSVTGRGATTTNNISVGNLSAVGGTFTDPVTIYDNTTTENPRLSIGRNSGESIEFDVTDVVNTITAKQDSDSDGDHFFVLDRVFAGSGDSIFRIHNDGTPDLTIDGNGVVTLNQYGTAGILQINTSGTISVDTNTYSTATGVADNADAYGSWTVSDGTNTENITSGATVAWRGSGATGVSYDVETNQFTISSTNTQYSDATTSTAGLMSTTDKSKLDGIESGADVTDSTNVAAAGALMSTGGTLSGTVKVTGSIIYENDADSGYIPFPKGAQYQTRTGSHTGAIKITLPTHGGDDMIKWVVDIYDYSTGESVTMFMGGYLYQTTGNNEWVSCTVTTLTEHSSKDYTVRFGADGKNSCVWIGETSSTWSYPQVVVRDFFAGFISDIDAYDDEWSISFVTSFDTVDETISDNLPTADWDRIEGKPSNATTSVDGFMSSTDKTKLDSVATNADVTPSWVPATDPSYLTSIPSEYLTETEGDARYVSYESLGRAVPAEGGWYRLAKIGRGGARFAISYTGGSMSPHTYIIDAFKNWNNEATISVEKFGHANYITGFRISRRAGAGNGDYYLEANFTSLSNTHSFEARYQEVLGYTTISEIYSVSSSTLVASDSSDSEIIEEVTTTTAEGLYLQNINLSGRLDLYTDSNTTSTTALVLNGTEVEKRTLGSNAFTSTSYAPLASPALTGTPTAPTAGSTTNTTQIATTAFVQTAVSNLVDSAPSTLDTLNELAAALGDDADFSTTVTNSIATKLPLAGGTLTGALTINQDGSALNLRSTTNAQPSRITFSSDVPAAQIGYIEYVHSDTVSYGSGEALIIGGNQATTTILADGKLMYAEGIYSKPSSGTGAGTRKDANWDNAYTYSQVGHLPLAGGTISGNINLGDSNKVILGTGSDFEMFHNGSNTFLQTTTGSVGDFYITARGTNHDLYLEAADDIFIRPQGNESGIDVIGNGAVKLYYDGAMKLETTDDGINVPGVAQLGATTFYSQDVNVGDADGLDIKWTLKNPNGNDVISTESGIVYRLRLVTLGTGTNTGAVYICDNIDGAGWRVKKVSSVDDGLPQSNYPFVEIDGGVPKVTIQHGSTYPVRVFVEGFIGGSTGASYTMLGLDSGITNENGSVLMSLASTTTEATSVMINPDGVLQKRDLGSLAFDSTTLGTAASAATTDFVAVSGDTMTGNLTMSSATPTLKFSINGAENNAGIVWEDGDAGDPSAQAAAIKWSASDNIMRFYNNDEGAERMRIATDGTVTFANGVVASGGISGLTLNNGGISGTNYNITGVNQLEIADPGEGIVFKSGSSGDMTLAIVDDANDNILKFSGTNAKFEVAGSLKHSGLEPTTGGAIDQISEFAMTFRLTADTWTDTDISGTDLSTGTYAMQVYVSDFAVGGQHYYEYYSATISWYGDGTNSTVVDEIPMHRAGHSPNAGDLQFRTQRAAGEDTHDLMLQVKTNSSYTDSLDNTNGGRIMRFKFRRLM